MDATKSLKLKRKQCEELNGNGLSLKAKKVDDRFSFDIEDSQIDLFKQGEIPANTAKNTEWSYRNFESWRVAKNKGLTETEKCPDSVLLLKAMEALCNWLCKFVVETRKENVEQYTPRSLYLLLAGLQRHVRNSQSNVNIFQDVEFKPLKNCCDSLFKRLHAKGIRVEWKETPALLSDEENQLWESGIISLDNPAGLLRALFFYNGKKLLP